MTTVRAGYVWYRTVCHRVCSCSDRVWFFRGCYVSVSFSTFVVSLLLGWQLMVLRLRVLRCQRAAHQQEKGERPSGLSPCRSAVQTLIKNAVNFLGNGPPLASRV